MPHTFLLVGSTWLNLDLVTNIDVVTHANDPSKVTAAQVWFTHGKTITFTDDTEVRALCTWLQAHKAP